MIHSRQVYDLLNGLHSILLARKMAGMIPIYNELTHENVSSSSVREFQRRVQQFIKMKAAQGDTSWSTVLSNHGDGAWPTWCPSGRFRTVVSVSCLLGFQIKINDYYVLTMITQALRARGSRRL